ncbi:hypothetical protein LCGC14_1852690 [marine sediment metagenome]|uniref:Uncharacterized protein n=1 Tax=marine sediment metagenome TaxID=412755 RepID=A0A0F9J919_9ZZZZ
MAGEAGNTDRLLRATQLVQCSPPKDHTSAAAVTEWVSLKGYGHCTFYILTGAWAAGTAAVTLNEAPLVSGVGTQALAFNNMFTNDAAPTSPLLVETAVASDTFNVDTALSTYVIEVDASELTEGFDCLNCAIASPGANTDLYTLFAVLSEPRYSPAVGSQVSSVMD